MNTQEFEDACRAEARNFLYECKNSTYIDKQIADIYFKIMKKEPALAAQLRGCFACAITPEYFESQEMLFRTGTSKAGKAYAFWGCTGYPECKHTENEQGPPCPKCGKPTTRRSGQGAKGPWAGTFCSAPKEECSHVTWENVREAEPPAPPKQKPRKQ